MTYHHLRSQWNFNKLSTLVGVIWQWKESYDNENARKSKFKFLNCGKVLIFQKYCYNSIVHYQHVQYVKVKPEKSHRGGMNFLLFSKNMVIMRYVAKRKYQPNFSIRYISERKNWVHFESAIRIGKYFLAKKLQHVQIRK